MQGTGIHKAGSAQLKTQAAARKGGGAGSSQGKKEAGAKKAKTRDWRLPLIKKVHTSYDMPSLAVLLLTCIICMMLYDTC